MASPAGKVDATAAAHVEEIKACQYAKYMVSEDVLERNFGYKIVRQQVSSGKNSIIYKCLHPSKGELYCVIKAYQLGKDKVKLSLKEETCQIMRYVSGKCPQLSSTLDVFYTNEKLYLMTDWAARGELLQLMRQRSLNVKLNEKCLQNWAVDIISAVGFLHANAICHRNIAPNCLLVTADNRVKIGTLSDAVIYCKPDGSLLKQKWVKFSRTSNWNQSPEVAKGKMYDPRKADIWSIGATLYWFITRQHPIDYKQGGKMTRQLEHRLGYMHKVSKKCKAFVSELLTFQPSARPFIDRAMQSEWFAANPSNSGQKEAAKEDSAQILEPSNKATETGEAVGPEEAGPEFSVKVLPENSNNKEDTQADQA